MMRIVVIVSCQLARDWMNGIWFVRITWMISCLLYTSRGGRSAGKNHALRREFHRPLFEKCFGLNPPGRRGAEGRTRQIPAFVHVPIHLGWRMVFLWRWLLLAFAFTSGCAQIFAAGARENRDYAAAAAAFQDGMYERATNEFAQFVEKYPNSGQVAEAILLRAQAELKLGEFTNASALLADTNNLAKAGKLADEYFYWTGEAQFQGTNYSGAAETWIALAQKFPESRLRRRAVVEAAAAFTKLARWQQTVALLEETNGVFQHAAQVDPGSEPVVRGKLLLAQAKFALKDFGGASAILEPLLASPTLKPELGHQGALLLYQVKLAAGEMDAALAVTTNLLQIAQLETNDDWQAEGVALRAGALEKLGRATDALAAYQENLTNAPVTWQREAVLKIAELAIAQKQFSVATNALGTFLAQFPDSPAADIALLTLGELRLKNYVAQPAATNQLPEVQAQFCLLYTSRCV